MAKAITRSRGSQEGVATNEWWRDCKSNMVEENRVTLWREETFGHRSSYQRTTWSRNWALKAVLTDLILRYVCSGKVGSRTKWRDTSHQRSAVQRYHFISTLPACLPAYLPVAHRKDKCNGPNNCLTGTYSLWLPGQVDQIDSYFASKTREMIIRSEAVAAAKGMDRLYSTPLCCQYTNPTVSVCILISRNGH